VRVEAGRRLVSIPTGKLSAAQRNDLNKSVKEYIQSQLVNAERPSSHLNLGILFAEQGEYENAEKAYRTALRLDPSFYPALVNLADLYRVQQRDEEGEAALRQALSLASDDANVHHSLGLLLVRVGKTKEAIASFERATTLGPEDPRHGYVYGIALNSIGEPTKAIAVLEKVHHRNPTDRQSLFTLVSIHREQGNQQLAVNFAEKLVALAPNDPSAQQVLEQLRTGGNK
jgi:Flp pilus assembly protein TadD